MFLFGKLCTAGLQRRSSIFSVRRSIKSALHANAIRQNTVNSDVDRSQAHLQVIGSGAPDQPASVILRVSNMSYLFNCGEGIKRYCQDSRVNFKKISNVFFTQSKWQCIGGILNLIFMTFTHSRPPPQFHGPNSLETVFKRMIYLSSKSFLFKHNFTSDVFTSNQRYEDKRIAIEPIELQSMSDTAVIYLCKIKEARGSYSLRKFLDRNLPNHLLPKLLRDEDVTLDDGTIVAAADIRMPDRPEVVFMCRLFCCEQYFVRFFFTAICILTDFSGWLAKSCIFTDRAMQWQVASSFGRHQTNGCRSYCSFYTRNCFQYGRVSAVHPNNWPEKTTDS